MEVVEKTIGLALPVICGFALAHILDIIIRLLYRQPDQHESARTNLFLDIIKMLITVVVATLLISLFLATLQTLFF